MLSQNNNFLFYSKNFLIYFEFLLFNGRFLVKQNRPVGDRMLTTQQILNYGVHLGATRRNAFMKKFIYKVRVDRVHIIDAKKLIERKNFAEKLLSH